MCTIGFCIFVVSETSKQLFTFLNLCLHFPFVASVWKTEQQGDFANVAKEQEKVRAGIEREMGKKKNQKDKKAEQRKKC